MSGSVSLVNTFAVSDLFSGVEKLSSFAVIGSLTLVTLARNTSETDAPFVSVAVKVIVAIPAWFGL